MTQQEHMLVVSMMAGLYHYIRALEEALRSNALIGESGLQAFGAIAGSSLIDPLSPDVSEDIRQFVSHYQQQAESLGLRTW